MKFKAFSRDPENQGNYINLKVEALDREEALAVLKKAYPKRSWEITELLENKNRGHDPRHYLLRR